MTKEDVKNLIKAARKEFADQMWGHDDDTAVDAFIKILKKHVKEAE